ncbi:uncharacterized protein LOC122501493 isoform X1 [Leptopilina heterotoma]|uniref:uncharacterized protein LOC122501493 isoform X1 n=1 Tax=Leptopilina heterotoma TaxID=63436 RepID=UPI001CA84735|nr:uncharacterized protein LOC122501493 isoform X1 [Leptopilina heterotoma]
MRNIILLFFICNIFYLTKSYPKNDVDFEFRLLPHSRALSHADYKNYRYRLLPNSQEIDSTGEFVFHDLHQAAGYCSINSLIECLDLANFHRETQLRCLWVCVTQTHRDPDEFVCKRNPEIQGHCKV